MNLTQHEHDKYATLWSSVPDYRNYSPGMENVQRFIDIMRPKSQSSVLDIGCGTGDAGLALEGHGLDPWWLDITDAGLNPLVPRERFIMRPLWGQWWPAWSSPDMRWDYGFCCDVMEHIPPEFTALVLDRILASCRKTWFNIALVPDQFGKLIGQPLHLTVRSFSWWRETFVAMEAAIEDARDLQGAGLFIVSRNEPA